MDDLTIKRDVEAELQWEPSIKAAAIGVAVKDGIVILTGRVSTWAARAWPKSKNTSPLRSDPGEARSTTRGVVKGLRGPLFYELNSIA